MKKNFEKVGIAELRQFVRFACPETRGAGKLGNIGKRAEIVEYLIAHNIGTEQFEAWKSAPAAAIKAIESSPVVPAAVNTPVASASAEASADNAINALRAALGVVNTPAQIDEKQVEAIAARVFASMNIPQRLQLDVRFAQDKAKAVVIDNCHYATPDIITTLSAGLHVMLTGPAGSGKTTTCEKVAEALKLDFYPMSLGQQTTKSDLLGFIDATGHYHKTVLREAFENGGLLLLDEMDAANAGVLTIINALLANGYCSFPDRVVKRHENFRCVAAANTYGRGADRQYVGRCQLDAATLDRFESIDFDYDENLEMALAGNAEWCKYVQCLRHAADKLKERIVISPRASIAGAKLLAHGMSREKVLAMTVFKGIALEIADKITRAAASEYSEYTEAIKQVNANVAD